MLFGERYWREVINWDKFLEFGVISQSDIDRLYFTDSAQDAFEHITGKLLQWESLAAEQAASAAEKEKTAAISAAAAAHAAAMIAAAEASKHGHTRSLVKPNKAGEPQLLPPLKPSPEEVQAASTMKQVAPTPGV